MRFKLDINEGIVDCIVDGEAKELDKHLSLFMTQFPQVRELLMRAITLSDQVEKEMPEVCKSLRAIDSADIFEENENWKKAFKERL